MFGSNGGGGGSEGRQERQTGVRFDPRQEDGQRFRGRWLMLLTALPCRRINTEVFQNRPDVPSSVDIQAAMATGENSGERGLFVCFFQMSCTTPLD